ncbi:MAG: carbohydrate ABC transporter permease [Deltaproteobacteria bacterium]|nr:carbohydrate ABC transporter permease [Deltaproteobacteria bacterium]MBW1960096.1 carbohydrate ABC transporter permease [Deltaproteobacteria bacterium]MBW2153691.1 carbohydrate ABC transporter permease [Deltaproteobacteria bacterium]
MSPFLWLVQMSFKTPRQIFTIPPDFIFIPTFQNYLDLFQESSFVRYFSNSFIASTSATILSLLIGVPAAYALSRTAMKAEKTIALWILTSRMAPPIAFAIPFFMMYRNLGLIDTRIGLIIIYLTFNLSLVIWMMRTFFDGIPRALEEAAYIDGAGMLETFLRITLPLTGPGIATTAIFCFLFSWNDFFYSLILTRSEAMTAPVAIVNFMNYEGWEWGKITAGSVVIMLPVIIFSLLVRKYLIRGLTAGALKN